jgi:intron-binding protein aquarius
MLSFYNGFEINDFSGEALTEEVMTKLHYDKMKKLQTLAFNNFQPELRKFALSNIGNSLEHIILFFFALRKFNYILILYVL